MVLSRAFSLCFSVVMGMALMLACGPRSAFASVLTEYQDAPAADKKFDASLEDKPVCRIHFFKNWSDTYAPDGAIPSSDFSKAMIRVFDNAGVILEPVPFMPWPRAVESVMRGRDHGLSVVLKTHDRLKKLEFLGPVFIFNWGAFRSLKREYDFKESPRVGIPIQFSHLTPVKEAVDAIGGEAVSMSLPRLQRMLDEGLIDLIFGPHAGQRDIDKAIGKTIVEVPSMAFEVRSYVAIRKDAPCISQKSALNTAIIAWSKTEEAQGLDKSQ